jgi:hypothetical protein
MSGATWAMQMALKRPGQTNGCLKLTQISKLAISKTTYTSFTLSATKHVAKLLVNGTALREDETPTYLEITLDKRMTDGPPMCAL